MKTIHILTTGTLLSIIAAVVPGANAQTAAPAAAPATTTTTPAAPAAAPAAQPGLAGYDKVIYVQRLPTVEEIVAAAPAGAVAERIEMLSGQVAVFYRLANGALNTVAYAQLAPNGMASTPPIPAGPAPATVPGTTPPPPGAPPAGAVPAATDAPGYYYYPAYSYPADPYYYYGYPSPYAYPYPYLFPFGGVRVGIGIGIGGHRR
jgi:hypothetical protein